MKPQKKRGRSQVNARKQQSLGNAGAFEGLRRSTRSSVKKTEVPDVKCRPLTRKRLRSMYSSDSMQAHEIVDITRSSGSASPPLLDAINTEHSTSKTLAQTKSKNSQAKGKNTSRGRKPKNKIVIQGDSSPVLKMPAKVKTEDMSEDEPPVLQKVSRKRTENSRYIDDDIYIVPSGPRSRSRSNSSRTEPPTLPVVEEKIKIKQEPASPTKNYQNDKIVQLNGASDKKAHNQDCSVSNTQKELKSKLLETQKNTVVKSGSSKRKQGGPTKFQKDKFKNIGFPQFLQPSSIPVTLASSAESFNSDKFSNSNFTFNFGPPKLFTSASAKPESTNSSETLKERYRKSFCSQPLPSTSSGLPKELEKTKQKIASFLKSRDPMKKLKENLARTPAPKLEKRSSAQNGVTNFVSGEELLQPGALSLSAKVKQEPISDEEIPLSQLAEPTSNLKIKSQKKPVRCMPIKKLERRRSSQCSNPEPQVVLTKLPDSQVDITNGTVALELLKKCEAEQEIMNADVGNSEHSETDSDEDKPLFLLGKIIKEQQKISAKSSKSIQDRTDKPSPTPSYKRSSTEATNPDSKKNKKSVHQHNSLDSEDSDCGLVIDLDRRPSVEERVPNFTLQRQYTKEDVAETENTNATSPQESKTTSPKVTPDQPNTLDKTSTTSFSSSTSDLPISKAETVELPLNMESLPSETSKPDISSLFRDATEEAHILLELSRSGAPPLDISGPPTTSWDPTLHAATSGLAEAAAKEHQESILRTLLLENGELSSLQEITPSISFDPKPVSVLQYMKTTADQEVHHHSPLSEMDKKQIREEILLTPDQLSVEIDTNPHFIPANYECCLSNPKSTLEVIQKLRDQIRYLQRKSERKNMSVLNLKRISKLCKYKEEILKRLMRRANMKEPSEWSQPKSQAPKQSSSQQPIPMATSSYAATSRLSSALLGNSLLKSKTPSATVTSSECYPGENLPTVATMVANATENYGVDLRTVTNRGPVSTSSKTILQEVLSSKDPIYRPVAIRSPLPQLERSSDSFLGHPMSPLASRESTLSPHRTSSPLLPELPRPSQLSRRLQSPLGSSSQFPPTLQPEPRLSSPFTQVAHGSFRNQKPFGAVSGTEAAKTSQTSSTSSGRIPSSNFISGTAIPQDSSVSMWVRAEAERSIKPSLINGAPKSSRKRTTDRRTKSSKKSAVFDPKDRYLTTSMDSGENPMSSGLVPSHQSNSFDPRAVQLSGASVDLRTSGRSDSQAYKVSSRRYAPYDTVTYQGSSNQDSSVDLRTNPMSYTSLSPGRMTNARSSFMIVPPPTTLQSAFSESIRRSMLDDRYSPSEMPMDRQLERIRERRNEGSIPHFIPHAGPLPSTSHFPTCAGCGLSKGCYICSLCKSTYYCSTKCQNLHWDEHSKTCSSNSNS